MRISVNENAYYTPNENRLFDREGKLLLLYFLSAFISFGYFANEDINSSKQQKKNSVYAQLSAFRIEEPPAAVKQLPTARRKQEIRAQESLPKKTKIKKRGFSSARTKLVRKEIKKQFTPANEMLRPVKPLIEKLSPSPRSRFKESAVMEKVGHIPIPEVINTSEIKKAVFSEVVMRESSDAVVHSVTVEAVEKTVTEDLGYEGQPTEEKNKVTYSPEDFSWGLRCHGLKKQAHFTTTPDGKVSTYRGAGVTVFKLSTGNFFDKSQGVFVEKSEDGEFFTGIGIINTTEGHTHYFADTESHKGEKVFYRFRGIDNQGNEVIFGHQNFLSARPYHLIDIKKSSPSQVEFKLSSGQDMPLTYSVYSDEYQKKVKAHQNLKEGENSIKVELNPNARFNYLELRSGDEPLTFLFTKETPADKARASMINAENDPATAILPKVKTYLPPQVSFDFFLKNGSSFVLNEADSEGNTVKIKEAEVNLSLPLTGNESSGTLWVSADFKTSFTAQRIPVLLNKQGEEIYAEINIIAADDIAMPTTVCTAENYWEIPGLSYCQGTELILFNAWGNTVKRIKTSTQERGINLKSLPPGTYSYLFGSRTGFIKVK